MDPDLNVFSLEDKVILITGGTRHYGKHFASALAEAGGAVAITSRDKSRADAIAAELTGRGLTAFGYALDQAYDESIASLVEAVLRDHGRIDVLINNARTVPRTVKGRGIRSELAMSFGVNAVGMILLTQLIVDEMKKVGRGNIINIGSIYGLVGQDLSLYEHDEGRMSWDYPLQKGGMVAFTTQIATCFARCGIRANCLSLGGLRETAPSDANFVDSYRKRTPLGRMAEPEDIRGPIVFLASDASAYMTGANLVVDGGWTAW